MILTPIPHQDLPAAFEGFARGLDAHPFAEAVLRRVAATFPAAPGGVDTPEHRAAGIDLAHRMGIATLNEEPAMAFSWDGRHIRTRSEASVIIHEVAHWQVCAPDRLALYDFGLGAGPETGRKAEADGVRRLSDAEREVEECLASLLGILWEVELGQPAYLAFLEQNWMEFWHRPEAVRHLGTMADTLRTGGFLDGTGRPVMGACA